MSYSFVMNVGGNKYICETREQVKGYDGVIRNHLINNSNARTERGMKIWAKKQNAEVQSAIARYFG